MDLQPSVCGIPLLGLDGGIIKQAETPSPGAHTLAEWGRQQSEVKEKQFEMKEFHSDILPRENKQCEKTEQKKKEGAFWIQREQAQGDPSTSALHSS